MIRVLGDFDLAEEAVQDAFIAALETWPERGIPANPGAWGVVRLGQPGLGGPLASGLSSRP